MQAYPICHHCTKSLYNLYDKMCGPSFIQHFFFFVENQAKALRFSNGLVLRIQHHIYSEGDIMLIVGDMNTSIALRVNTQCKQQLQLINVL